MRHSSDRTIGRIAKDLQLYLQGCTKARTYSGYRLREWTNSLLEVAGFNLFYTKHTQLCHSILHL